MKYIKKKTGIFVINDWDNSMRFNVVSLDNFTWNVVNLNVYPDFCCRLKGYDNFYSE